jgi:hypothetical protein
MLQFMPLHVAQLLPLSLKRLAPQHLWRYRGARKKSKKEINQNKCSRDLTAPHFGFNSLAHRCPDERLL